MAGIRFHQARISHIGGWNGALALAAKWFCVAAIALGGAGLAGCSAPRPAPPAPVYYSSQPIPNPTRRPPPPTTATPASATTGGAPSEASPVATPETQLPAEAQSPIVAPAPGGSPHDSSEYIEPPSR